MDEVKIREDGFYLNGEKLKTCQGYKIKRTAEDGYATVYIKLSAKLI